MGGMGGGGMGGMGGMGGGMPGGMDGGGGQRGGRQQQQVGPHVDDDPSYKLYVTMHHCHATQQAMCTCMRLWISSFSCVHCSSFCLR